MKPTARNRTLSTCLLLLLCLGAWVWLPGCSTTSPEAATYATIDSSRVLVTSALRAWGDYCRSVEGTDRRVPLSVHLKVQEAYSLYRQAALAAVDSAMAWQAGTGPEPAQDTGRQLSVLAGNVVAIIAAAKESTQ